KVWKLTAAAERRKFHLDPEQRRHTAYHEAGHAVIGLAVQLPVAYAVSVPSGRERVGHVAMVHKRNRRIERGYRIVGGRPIFGPDAFGNEPRTIERTPEEHRAEIVMCFAGPMAEAKVRNQDWRSLASNSDMDIARNHHGALGAAAKSWEEYE